MTLLELDARVISRHVLNRRIPAMHGPSGLDEMNHVVFFMLWFHCLLEALVADYFILLHFHSPFPFASDSSSLRDEGITTYYRYH